MFPCFFFFKNCISLLAQFQDVFFHNVFSSIGFSMSIFQGLYFAIFSCARLQVFSNMIFPVRYIFSRAVFPEPCFFQNVFSRIAFFHFFCAPCAYQFFPECFFQNCILLIFPAPYARMFFPELYFVHFFLHLVLISVFPECFFQNCILLIFSCTLCLYIHFFPGCFFQNCILFIFSCILCLSVFFQNVFPRTVFCQFFPAPLDFRLFPSCCSRDIVFFQKIFSVMLDLVVFPVQQHFFTDTCQYFHEFIMCANVFVMFFLEHGFCMFVFSSPIFFSIVHAQMLFFLCIHQFVFFADHFVSN